MVRVLETVKVSAIDTVKKPANDEHIVAVVVVAVVVAAVVVVAVAAVAPAGDKHVLLFLLLS